MIFKIIGGLITVSTCYFLGYLKSGEFSERVGYLSSMQSCVNKLTNEIRYTQTPFLRSFQSISKTSNPIIQSIFLNVIEFAEHSKGETLSVVWRKAIENSADRIHISDRELFMSFGDCLCAMDLEGQMKSLEHFSMQITDALNEAILLRNKNIKLYKNLGLYSGILLFLLFF